MEDYLYVHEMQTRILESQTMKDECNKQSSPALLMSRLDQVLDDLMSVKIALLKKETLCRLVEQQLHTIKAHSKEPSSDELDKIYHKINEIECRLDAVASYRSCL